MEKAIRDALYCMRLKTVAQEVATSEVLHSCGMQNVWTQLHAHGNVSI